MLRAITQSDIESVLLIEEATQAFPWRRGQFVDALAAGYWLWGVFAEEAEVNLVTPALQGFMVAMPVYDEAHVLNMAVGQEYRGQGVARQLWQHLQTQLQAPRPSPVIGSVLLEVAAQNHPAIAVYRHWGFVVIGARAHYYRQLDRQDDAWVMRYVLP